MKLTRRRRTEYMIEVLRGYEGNWTQAERMKTALEIAYIWAQLDLLDPEHVSDLCEWALGDLLEEQE